MSTSEGGNMTSDYTAVKFVLRILMHDAFKKLMTLPEPYREKNLYKCVNEITQLMRDDRLYFFQQLAYAAQTCL